MAFNNYYPATYQPYPMQMPQAQPQPVVQQPAPQSNSSIIWVQGESGAKSFMTGAGQSVMLMDSEKNVFYIKSTDQSGMPLPLRIFDYTERTAQTVPEQIPQENTYITREEFERRIAELFPTNAKKEITTTRKEKTA
jgi:hypothetical protein